MDVTEGTTTDDLWTPYKELVSVVEGYLTTEGGGAPYAVQTFESVLRRHKQTFLNLFKHPPKNPASRDEIKRGITEGVRLPSVGRTFLSKELVDEAIIISDMYNVNEYLALELLHTAQKQMPRHPGLPRGLVAILLYYDGRRALVHALKEIFMARDGVCWCISSREEIVSYVSRYADSLVAAGGLRGALDALRRLSPDADLQLLQQNRALLPPPYHARLLQTMHSTRKLLAGVVFAASAQRGLDGDIILRLLAEQTTSPGHGATGALDEVSLTLQMALLYALDLSVLYRREDGEELAKKLALIQDANLLSMLVEELSPQPAGAGAGGGGARALCQLALGLALAALKRASPGVVLPAPAPPDLLDQDAALVDAAIDSHVFEYIEEAILSTDFVSKEEYYQRRIHTLITDFIVLMHSKLMEMRVKAEESSRAAAAYLSEGLSGGAGGAGAGRTRLDALLRCVERLYARDPLRLRDDYWEACTHSALTHRSGGRAATLYKFVRLSGELVSAALVPAYLRALAALAVPRHTWALLARRDALSAHHALTALARYYCTLRSDPSPLSEPRHAASMGASALAPRAAKLLVRHEEVEAMIAALKLLAGVARADPAACAAICDNLQWDAVNVMFGVMRCHVPLPLKAELCSTLAALGSTASTAPRVWAAFEAARLLTPADKSPLAIELDEVECRMEEYPLSVAFLTLVESLCAAAPLPRALGAGSRAPGLDPYLEHALYRLALPAPNRLYAIPHQKWQILSLCFRLFARWLDQYEPCASDFPPAHRAPDLCPPPGFRLAMQLHNKSELLRLVLASVEEALLLLEAQPPPPGKEFIERALISVLQILERALALERALVSAAAAAERAVPVLGLSKLMLVPEEGATSCRLVWWCRCVRLAGALPEAAARAVQLLGRALHHAAAARDLLAAVSHHGPEPTLLRHGFVECLEAEEWGEGTESGDKSHVRVAKEGVVALILQVLPTAPPNLAHFLLGYQLTENVGRSALHEPGVAGAPRTCLHAALDTLDRFLADHGGATREADDLIEGCYRLVYRVVSGSGTGAPALRFLRSRDYFLSRHVKRCVDLRAAAPATVSARSWVVRAAACEAAAAAGARHHAALAALAGALTHTTHHPAEWEVCVLRRLVESLPVSVAAVEEPRWEVFSSAPLRAAIEACSVGRRVSVPRLHALLARELAALPAAAPHVALVTQDIHRVLEYVTAVNRQRNLAATLTHYYDSWRQLTEILFCVVPHDILDLEARKNLLLNIIQDLLNKISPAEVLPQLGNLASGTVLLLLVNLRHCYVLQKREANLKGSDFESTLFGPSNHLTQTNSLTLKFILHKILSWISVSGGCTQTMRVNLYGALLNLLNIVNMKPSTLELEEESSSTYVSRLDSSRVRPTKEESSLKATVVDVIDDFGESLCSIVCGDCIGAGHDVCRMLALACLDALMEVNPRTDWLNTLTNQGYLRSLIDSLQQDDQHLKEALEASAGSLRALYVYESKVALVTKVARTRRGAETVLAQGALARLADLQALRHHPDVHSSAAPHAGFVPPPSTRFRQIVIPALALCDALLTTLGTSNHSCVTHVTHFLVAHLDCIDTVLRAAHPESPRELLTEVEWITSVVSRACDSVAAHDSVALHDSVAAHDSVAHHESAHHESALQRVRALMLGLLTRFHTPPQQATHVYYKIVCNCVRYAASVGGAAGGAAGSSTLLARLVQLAHEHDKLLATAAHRLRAHHTLTLDDMKKLVSGDSAALPAEEVRAAGAAALQAAVEARRRELESCTLALESAVCLVWRRLRDQHRHGAAPAHALHATEGACEGLSELRKELVALFTDRFTEDLLDTAKNQPAAQRGFLAVLVKEIKSMIQFSPV